MKLVNSKFVLNEYMQINLKKWLDIMPKDGVQKISS